LRLGALRCCAPQARTLHIVNAATALRKNPCTLSGSRLMLRRPCCRGAARASARGPGIGEPKGAQITDIERDSEHGQTIYEVEFVLDGKEYELDIAADGQLLERRLD
jgi:hypothetical protein